MWRIIAISFTFLVLANAAIIPQEELKPLTTSADRIKGHGYPAESHFTETEDGYVLNIFRIPYSHKLNNKDKRRPVVFLQHGLFSCSESFLLNGPDDAIAYNFADAGFDVWLGNARGNIYSRNNTRMSPDHPHFWHFSWHEIGAIDIAQMFDYILKVTGEKKLHYVGHSQGGTVYFVLMSIRPEYNEKIKTAHMLAPAVFMGNSTTGIVVRLNATLGRHTPIKALIEDQEFLPENTLINRILDTACTDDPPMAPEKCHNLFEWYAGEQVNMNLTLAPQMAETHPAGISTNQGIHFIQSYDSNDFRRYDFGTRKNLKEYNQEIPPSYPVEKVTSPVFLYYGLNDGSANKKDLIRLDSLLPNVQELYEVPIATWGHLDFIFALKVKEVINDRVIAHCLASERNAAANEM